MTDKDSELKENIKFLAKCCSDEYNDIRIDAVLLGALELINRQQTEISELMEDIEVLRISVGLRNNRKYYKKFVDEVFQKQKGKELSTPDFDYIYELYFKQQAEIERLTADNKLLKADAHADTVEVVRCRDCRYRGNGDVCPMFHLCYSVSKGYYWEDFTVDNKFCSYGKRKEVDTE